MNINQYEFLRDGKPFEPTREEIVRFAEYELAEKDKEIEKLRDLAVGFEENFVYTLNQKLQQEKENRNLRHQVCEEIRKYMLRYGKYNDMNTLDHQGGNNVHNVIERFLEFITKGGIK